MTISMSRRILMWSALSILAVHVVNLPQIVLAQTVRHPGHNGITVWQGAQRGSSLTHQPLPGSRQGAAQRAPQYGSPGIVQHPTASQPALGSFNRQGNRYSHDQWRNQRSNAGVGVPAIQRNPSSYLQDRQYPRQIQSAQPYGPRGSQQYPGPRNTAQQQQRSQQQNGQPGQFPAATDDTGSGQQAWNQATQNQQQAQAAQQIRPQQDPMGVPVLSPAANQFFYNLKGPNLSTWNQNRNHYSFTGQTTPGHQIPGITWQSGSRFGQTTSRRNNYNQTMFNQNRHNYSLRSITTPSFRGYR